ncbi:MAG: hypothetical protein AVDCRST_MAG30-3681, partial [uncultured Solirubrobacteraceae bacterium]
GPEAATADPPTAAGRVHRPRAEARAPVPARAAGRRRGHLEPDARLPLRHPRRPPPRGAPAGPPGSGGSVHRSAPAPARRAVPDDLGPRVDRHQRAAGRALPAALQQVARHRGRAALAGVPSCRDDRLAGAARGGHAQRRPARAGHRRAGRHPRPADGPGRDGRRRAHAPRIRRVPRDGRRRL